MPPEGRFYSLRTGFSASKRATPTRATRIPDAPATLVDSVASLGGYDVLGTLGRGGMATTFRARRRRDGAFVALKIPHEMCLGDPTFVARFLREGSLGEQLHHPGIVRIHEAGEEAGRPFLALELLSGRTLKQVLREDGAFPLRRALEVVRDIAQALDYAHTKGVVPFTADSPYRVIEMHMRTPLPARDELKAAVPPAIWAIVTGLCAKDRETVPRPPKRCWWN